MTVTLALTHYNRFKLLVESFSQVLGDPRISEIVIVDDCSTDGSFQKIEEQFRNVPKVRVYQNSLNLDCYLNKREAVRKASNDWVILFDSDNIMTKAYLDALFRWPSWSSWQSNTFYCPDFAQPHFDYRAFSGQFVDRFNIRTYIEKPMFECALNTANYLVPKKGYLEVFDDSVNPHTSDTIFQAFNWIRKNGILAFVPGLQYSHRIHDGSHYKKNNHKTGAFADQVKRSLKALF